MNIDTPLPHAERKANTCSLPSTKLTRNEIALRDRCYSDLEQYESASLNAGSALISIHESRLYRETHGTFEAFVTETRAFNVRRAQQLMQAYRVFESLADAGVEDLPSNEAQVRPLASLSGETQLDVWNTCLAEHGSPGALSKAKVEAVVKRHIGASSGADANNDGTASDDISPDYTSRLVGSPAMPSLPYGNDVQDAFAEVPADSRDAVQVSLEIALSLGEDVTPDTVREAAETAAETAAAERAEDGKRSGQAVVIGAATGVVENNRLSLLGGARKTLIEDIDYITPQGDDASSTEDKSDARESLLLVVIPTSLCPDSLLDAYSGARQTVAGRAEVVVLLSELEEHGGPVENGVLDIGVVREAARTAGLKKSFNKTGKLVGWANYSTNPFTGCSHRCSREFCYASDAALRFYPQAFVPTIHPARLDAFANTTLPDTDDFDNRKGEWCRSVFLGSMGDLMNHSFPSWWIQAVIDEIAAHPDRNVFVLTKLAARLSEFEWPDNAMIGVTVTSQREVRAAARGLARVTTGGGKWISAEPMLGPIDPEPLLDAGATFFAIGGQSPTRWDRDEKQPDPADVRDLMMDVWARGGYVYSKENLDWIGHIPFPGTDPYQGAPLPEAHAPDAHVPDAHVPDAQPATPPGAPAPDRGAVPARGPRT